MPANERSLSATCGPARLIATHALPQLAQYPVKERPECADAGEMPKSLHTVRIDLKRLLNVTIVMVTTYFLIVHFLPCFILQKLVDFRASCFCHRRPVEFAFMCSVCLALTCDLPELSCSTCGTAVRRISMKGSLS